MPDKIEIILADDHPIVRQGLRLVIEREADLIVAAECGDGAAALAAIEEFAPDVAVLDVDMPHATGFDVLRQLGGRGFKTRIVLLTVHDAPEFIGEALRLGASGYLPKESAVIEVVAAIRRVAAGEIFIGERLEQNLSRYQSNVATPSSLVSLTATERRVLKLIAEYKSSKEIADALFISALTVKTHRRNICAKLGIEGNNALMRFALDNKVLL